MRISMCTFVPTRVLSASFELELCFLAQPQYQRLVDIRYEKSLIQMNDCPLTCIMFSVWIPEVYNQFLLGNRIHHRHNHHDDESDDEKMENNIRIVYYFYFRDVTRKLGREFVEEAELVDRERVRAFRGPLHPTMQGPIDGLITLPNEFVENRFIAEYRGFKERICFTQINLAIDWYFTSELIARVHDLIVYLNHVHEGLCRLDDESRAAFNKCLAEHIANRLNNSSIIGGGKTRNDCDYLAQLVAFYFIHKFELHGFCKGEQWARVLLPGVRQSPLQYFLNSSIDQVNFSYLLDAQYFQDETR